MERYMTVERWKNPEVRAKSGIVDLFAFAVPPIVEKTQRQAEHSLEMAKADEMWSGRLDSWGLWKESW